MWTDTKKEQHKMSVWLIIKHGRRFKADQKIHLFFDFKYLKLQPAMTRPHHTQRDGIFLGMVLLSSSSPFPGEK